MEQNTIVDLIEFYHIDVDKRDLRGVFVRYDEPQAPYAETKTVIRIGFAETLNDCWSRLVCCKELMHAFDGTDYRVTSASDLRSLTSGLLVPGSTASLSEIAKNVIFADETALVNALAVLVPLDVARTLREAFLNNKLGLMDIAQSLRIPLQYVEYVLSDAFEAAHLHLGTQ